MMTNLQNREGAVVQQQRGVAPASRTAPSRAAASSSTFAVPQSVHKPAAFAAPAAFNLNDDWVALQFEQIESCMAAAGALGVSTGAAHAAPAHAAPAAPIAAGAACDTQAMQTLALCRTDATAGDKE